MYALSLLIAVAALALFAFAVWMRLRRRTSSTPPAGPAILHVTVTHCDEPDDGDPGEPVDVDAPLHAWWTRPPEVTHVLRAGAALLLGLMAGAGAMLLPALALAQGVDAGAPDAPGLDPAAQSALMALGAQLVAALVGAGPSGWVAALTAGAQALVMATKAPAFEPLFAARSWLRPLVAVVGGLVLAVVGAIATGTPILPALITGPMAGALAVGLRELYVTLAGTVTKDERAAGKAISDAVKGTDAEVAAKVAAIKADLDRAAAPGVPEADRLKAMADAWNKQGAVTP